jgi:hypothetical protein
LAQFVYNQGRGVDHKGRPLGEERKTVECIPNAPVGYSDNMKYKNDIIWNQIGNNIKSKYNMPSRSWDGELLNGQEI